MEKTMQNNEKDSQQQAQEQTQPQSNFGPAPAAPNAPYQQQPVNQQYFAQPQAAPVQYVVMAESLKGVKGWLLFFAVCFALSGIGYVGSFFTAMTDLSEASSIVSLIFSPILATAAITTTVFIAMQKKIAKWMAVGTLGLFALVGVINTIIGSVVSDSSSSAPLLISAIITELIFAGLFMLYFFVSKRVKETLVN